MAVDLSKYLKFQKNKYTNVYMQVKRKVYDSGWVDYIFPRLESQCDSPRSYGTGLNSEKEVTKFWSNKLLRNNYLEIIKLFNVYSKEEYNTIVSDRGKFKIKQSVELFIPLCTTDTDREILIEFMKSKYSL